MILPAVYAKGILLHHVGNGRRASDEETAEVARRSNAYPRLVAALQCAYASADKRAREEIGAILNDLGEAQ